MICRKSSPAESRGLAIGPRSLPSIATTRAIQRNEGIGSACNRNATTAIRAIPGAIGGAAGNLSGKQMHGRQETQTNCDQKAKSVLILILQPDRYLRRYTSGKARARTI